MSNAITHTYTDTDSAGRQIVPHVHVYRDGVLVGMATKIGRRQWELTTVTRGRAGYAFDIDTAIAKIAA